MRRIRTALISAVLLASVAAADEGAGVQVLIDMQDPSQIQKNFCVRDSKLYSQDALVCVSGNVSLSCQLVDATDPTKGVKWVQTTEEKNRCRAQ